MERLDKSDGTSVVVFHSSATVGLIVTDGKGYTGSFLSPEEARKLASDLNRYADDAQLDRERDVLMQHNGSIVLLRPVSKPAYDWIVENVNADFNIFGILTVEPRRIDEIVAGMREAGLTVS